MNARESKSKAGPPEKYFLPAVDVTETPEELLLVADMPGVAPEDLEVTIEDGILTFRGAVPEAGPEASAEMVQREFLSGDYYRQFRVPREFAAEEINASLKAGVVTIRIPRDEKSKPRRIAIQVEEAPSDGQVDSK